jgi:hypothetical protein
MPEHPHQFERHSLMHEYQEKIADLQRTNNEAIEHEVLMPLWSNLGDQTETYWEAMNASGSLVDAHKALSDVLSKVGSRPLRRRLVKALIEILTRHESITDEIEALTNERDRKLSALS